VGNSVTFETQGKVPLERGAEKLTTCIAGSLPLRSENRETTAAAWGITTAWIWTTTLATAPSKRETIVLMDAYLSLS
jgi:hypothetical protein